MIYLTFNAGNPATIRGWAIPAATDIAFALGVLSLLGNRVPTSLKVFLAALAIIDDLGAVVIIALFYSGALDMVALGGAALVLAGLVIMNRVGVMRLWPYLILSLLMWYFVLLSGVHTTVAGVLLALTIPLRPTPARPDDIGHSPLHKLEHALHGGVTFLVIRAGWADMPAGASRLQLLGVSLLCGIGFTMSLFIGLLAFVDAPHILETVKISILGGSLLAGLLGYTILRIAPPGA